MDSRHQKWAMGFLCALLTLMGCENPTEEYVTNEYYTADKLSLTLDGSYRVTHPDDAQKHTNYIVLAVAQGDYTKGTYTLNGAAVTPTPVLTNGGRTTLVKIAAPDTTTSITLAVKEGEEIVLEATPVTFTAAGASAPKVLYGEKFMTFSEFFHDITADIADIRPSSTVFSATGYVAEPKKFINAGTRTGNSSAGTAGGTPKWTETDLLPKVDAISSATYGDNPHFVPTKNLAMNYPDPMTKADWHEVTGIKTVEVGVDFDLFANADLLRQAGGAVAASAAVLATVDDISWKASTEVYKAKYLRPDASWGRRDQTAINEAKGKDWPEIGNNATKTAGVSYGGAWADKVISVDFGPLPASLTSATLWNDYFDYVYAGYVEDSTGHKEPLVWLQNLFSHRGHTNLEAALDRAGISRMSNLTPAGDITVVMFAQGFKDIVVVKTVSAYDGQSSASIEQGAAFHVSGTGAAANFQDAGGNSVPNKELHVTGLSPAALADFAAKGGKLLKGTADVPPANYELEYEEEDAEVAIKLKDTFFDGAFQGAYSFSVNSDTAVYKAISFAVNRIIDRPQLTQAGGTASDASADSPITVTTNGGRITFSNEDFAKAIVTTGRGVSTITPPAGTSAPAITTVLKQDTGAYYIDASVLSAGTWTLNLLVNNFVKADRTNISPVVYTIIVQ
jgi:hypothetical protein